MEKEKQDKLRWWIDFTQTDLDRLSEKEKSHLQIDFSFNYAPWTSSSDILRQGGYDLETLKAVQAIISQLLNRALKLQGIQVIFLPPLRRQLMLSSDGKRFEIVTLPLISVAQKISLEELSPEIDWLTNEFSRLLEGISKDAIKRCEECKRLFLHLSAKKKIYCSARCSYRFLSRKKREQLRKHPRKYKAYLKQQRELMKRKYDEKIKAQHPKARIGKKEV